MALQRLQYRSVSENEDNLCWLVSRCLDRPVLAGMVSRYGILRAKDGKYKIDKFTGLVDKLRATYFKQNIDNARIASKIQWNPVANHETLGKFLPVDVEAYACWETVGICYTHTAALLRVMPACPILTVHALSTILRRTSIDLA